MPKTAPKSKPKTRSKAAARQKTTMKQPVATIAKPAGPRRLEVPKRIWYKPLSWQNHPPVPNYRPLPKARRLFVASLKMLWLERKLFGGIILVFGVLNILLVRGLTGSSDLSTLKSALDSLSHGFGGKLTSSFTSFVYLLSTSGSGNTDVSGVYQSILLIICSLAVIWALRQVSAKHNVRIRDSFYHGMYPLIPFLLLFVVIGLQLLPLVIGGGIYSLVVSNGIAIHIWEKALFVVLFLSLAVWSLRMLASSVFALYIVTLPDMTPLKALRSARSLVYGRRLMIWRKLLFLPVILLVLAIIIELPLILFIAPLAAWVFFVLSMAALGIVHSYLYNLYRELL